MATKQLNSVNPRNFREKIELLKRKEAASTANFAAAIRDAREIRQIAGGCDPSQFKTLAVQSAFERSLSKACSVPNVVAGTTSFASSTDRRTETVHQTTFNFKDVSLATNCSDLQHEQTSQLLAPNTNGHLMSLLSAPAAHIDSLDLKVSASNAARSTGNLQNCLMSSNHGSSFSNQSTTASYPFSPVNSHATTQCSRTLEAGVQPNPRPVPSAFSYRRVQRYASGDQLPSPMAFSVPYNNQASGGTTHSDQSNTSFSLQLNSKTVTAPYIGDDPNVSSAPYTTLHYTHMGGRGLHTAQTSLGPLHSSSPYCGTQVTGSYQKAIYDHSSGTPHTMMSVRPGLQDERNSWNTTGFNMNIDWRRVSSDSSIHHSLMNYPTMPTDHVAYSTSISQAVPPESTTGSCRPETLRRHFPSEPEGVVEPTAYEQPNCYSPNAIPAPVASVSVEVPTATLPQSDISPAEEHVLPAKRPFTGLSIQSVGCTSPNRYSRMDDLSLEDTKICLGRTHEHHMLTVASSNVNQGSSSSKLPPLNGMDSATMVSSSMTGSKLCPESENPGFLKPKGPGPSTESTELSSELNNLSGFDSRELDHYLQIPLSLLESDSSTRWASRRDSCTMAAEVLSALATPSSDSSLSADRPKCNQVTTPDSCYPKVPDHLSAVSDASSSYYCPAPATTLFESSYVQSSDFQDVASKLGISMTPNDYQLLTNPQLANYVTDETTETQLLG